MSPSPRRNASGVPVGMGAVPNPVLNPTLIPSTAPISFPSPRGDDSGAPVGMVAVPKTCQKPPSPRRNASGVLVGMGAVPKTGQKTLFATPECHWSTCGVGPRADDLSEDSLFPVFRPTLPSSRPAIHPHPAPPSHPPARLCFLARGPTVGPVTLSIS